MAASNTLIGSAGFDVDEIDNGEPDVTERLIDEAVRLHQINRWGHARIAQRLGVDRARVTNWLLKRGIRSVPNKIAPAKRSPMTADQIWVEYLNSRPGSDEARELMDLIKSGRHASPGTEDQSDDDSA
jgi:hypothetical protein